MDVVGTAVLPLEPMPIVIISQVGFQYDLQEMTESYTVSNHSATI
jgi:hypothetical protein